MFLLVFPLMSVGMEKPGVVEQVDLTPTLALGLGLPVSQNSVGRLIPGVLEETSLRDQLRFLHLNGHQLSCLLKDSMPDYQKGRLQIHRVEPLDSLKAQKARTGSLIIMRYGFLAGDYYQWVHLFMHSNVTVKSGEKRVKFKE